MRVGNFSFYSGRRRGKELSRTSQRIAVLIAANVSTADEAVFRHPLDPVVRGVEAHAYLSLEPRAGGLLVF
jgi:hypothetical protein